MSHKRKNRRAKNRGYGALPLIAGIPLLPLLGGLGLLGFGVYTIVKKKKEAAMLMAGEPTFIPSPDVAAQIANSSLKSEAADNAKAAHMAALFAAKKAR